MKPPTSHANGSSGEGLLLPGLDGANPVGFLAALGVLRTVSAGGFRSGAALAWEQVGGSWVPRLYGIASCVRQLTTAIVESLHVPFTPDANAEAERESAQKEFDEQKKRLRKAIDSLKKRKLRGTERQQAERDEIQPIEADVSSARSKWLESLKKAVPSEEMSLGKHLNATRDELRNALQSALESASAANRETLDLYAAFGSDACIKDSGLMAATPFCFTTGSGNQYFLDTVRQLYSVTNSDRIAEALVEKCEPNDEKLSLRWDPGEDRRYAVMWNDPGTGDKPKTSWARNLLAYRGIPFFPCVPGEAGKLNSSGWTTEGDAWYWPVWSVRLSASVIRSLLTSPSLTRPGGAVEELRLRGVGTIFQCQRIQVGNPPLYKINFGPARRIG